MRKWTTGILMVGLLVFLVACAKPSPSVAPPPRKNDGSWGAIPQPVQVSPDGIQYKVIWIDGLKFIAIPTWGGNWVIAR